MATLKITVLKRMANQELADRYCVSGVRLPCRNFTEGQEFVVQGGERPTDFCAWAWNDIHKVNLCMVRGGCFSGYKDTNTAIACCTDGIQPVVFKVEMVGD